jgi:uncharacterized protein (DUF302 family)
VKKANLLPINVLIQEKDHLNVTSVIKHSKGNTSLLPIYTIIQKKDHLNVTSAAVHSEENVPLLPINVFIHEKGRLNVTSVIKHSTYMMELTVFDIKISILEKDHSLVTSVTNHFLTSVPLLDICKK